MQISVLKTLFVCGNLTGSPVVILLDISL